MSATDELLNQALTLPDPDRARIARSLLRSLGPPTDIADDSGQEFEQRLRERIDEVRSGQAELVEFDDAMAELRQRRLERLGEQAE